MMMVYFYLRKTLLETGDAFVKIHLNNGYVLLGNSGLLFLFPFYFSVLVVKTRAPCILSKGLSLSYMSNLYLSCFSFHLKHSNSGAKPCESPLNTHSSRLPEQYVGSFPPAMAGNLLARATPFCKAPSSGLKFDNSKLEILFPELKEAAFLDPCLPQPLRLFGTILTSRSYYALLIDPLT